MDAGQIAQIKAAIGKDNWKKDSYVFACNAMAPYGYYQAMRKTELIEKFYALLPAHFGAIHKFSTFRALGLKHLLVQ
ncbi:MAG: hypothetical protein V4594_20270 [Bacteroidota bacterium]